MWPGTLRDHMMYVGQRSTERIYCENTEEGARQNMVKKHGLCYIAGDQRKYTNKLTSMVTPLEL